MESLSTQMTLNDRDLLIRLDENVKNVLTELRDLKEGTATTLNDHELRLRRLEMWGAIAIGLSYALQFYMSFINKN